MTLDLKHLNKQQHKAVTYGDKPILVIAGAGSGKTRVLTYRVAHLLERGYRPSRLMVTTFTKAASEEMIERLEPLIGETKADRIRIGTFHSICLRIFKDLLDYVDVDEDKRPRLLMGGGQWMTMVGIIGKYKWGKDPKQTRFATRDIKALLSKISYWKNEGLRVKDIKKKIEGMKDGNGDKLQITDSNPDNNPHWKYSLYYTYYLAYKAYQKELKSNCKIDFDDMLFKTYYMLNRKKPKYQKFLANLRRKIEHLLVDEAQDLNKIQFMLVNTLAGDNRRITLVGDDYQVLYGFRGARVKEIINFGEEYKANIIKLETNYRSTPEIVEAGNKLIKNNTVQVWKNLKAHNESGLPIQVMMSRTVDEEADAILEKIEDMILNGYELGDIALLYRTNAQSRALVDRFIQNHIPHKVYSKEGFYDRKEVKDMLAYLKIACTPYECEPEDFGRIINKPARFLGKKFIEAIEDLMFDNGYSSFWEALKGWNNIDLSQMQSNRASQFVAQMQRLINFVNDPQTDSYTHDIFQFILDETKYLEWFNKETESESEEPDNDTAMNLDALMVGAHRFHDPHEFLMFVDSMDYEENEDDDSIHLMTVHKSKGMEFPVVFMLGVCERVMPHHKAENLEEERRIAYVAITRAQEELYVSTIYEKYNSFNTSPSRFISEMGAEFPTWWTNKVTSHKKALESLVKEDHKPTYTKYDAKGKVIKVIDIPIDNCPGAEPIEEGDFDSFPVQSEASRLIGSM